MENKHHRLRNILLILLGIIVVIVIVVIAFISPIVKYAIEKYDEKYTGRQVTMDWAYVNPFSGYIYFNDLKIYESKSDSVFFSANGISLHLDMYKLLSKEYEIKDLTFNSPKGIVVQYKKNVFNFSDLVEKFSAKPNEPKENKPPVHFNLLNVLIKNGEFHLRELMTPVNYYIKNVTVDCSGKRWNADTTGAKFSFDSGIGSGNIKGDIHLNTTSSDYRMAVVIHNLDLKLIEQYLKDLTNYGSLRAFVDADVKAKGNFNDGRNVDAQGQVAISDFHFGSSPNEDIVSFKKFILIVDQLNPKMHKYMFDSVSLTHPFFKFERYDHLDNIENIFGQKGSKVAAVAASPEKFNLVIEMAKYVKLLAKNFFRSDYKINRLAIYKGNFKFNDYSISEKFSIAANPLTIIADSINKNKKRVTFQLHSGIKPYGNLAITLSINPNDSSDFELNYNVEKINAAVLNPYLVTHTTFPLDRGSIQFKGASNVKNGAIQSNNHLLVIDPRITQRIKNKNNSWLPLRLIMFFVRERGNAIDYEIPITGNLNNPHFHFKDVIFDILTNVFVKPATTIYRTEVKTVENTIEKTLVFNWEIGASKLMSDEEKFIEKLVGFLKKNPTASISAQPMQYAEKEKEYILFFEAKKQYYLIINKKTPFTFSEKDSISVSKMSVKDSMFVNYLNAHLKDKMLFTIQQKCTAFVGSAIVNKKFDQLIRKREEVFKNYFIEQNLSDRLKIRASQNEVPFNGFSYYKISYNGEVPEELKKAFEKLNEFDNESPRKKLKEEREKTRKFFNLK